MFGRENEAASGPMPKTKYLELKGSGPCPGHHCPMNEMIRFVANYDDLSTDKGFQFKFHCDKCGNGHQSRFKTNSLGMASSLLNAAGSRLSSSMPV